jgi:parallel beta-helix repeat protein
MMKPERWQRLLLGLCGGVLATFGLVSAGEAASCGDTAGLHRTRSPCACGDTVVTSTRLRATDPVVNTACTETDEALIIGADNITLDCRGLAISGGSAEEFAFHGIFSDRNGVTIQNCTVQFFFDGIEVLGHGNRILNNVALDTLGGIVILGDDNRIEGNRSERAFFEGIVVLGGLRNLVTRNQATHCFDGLVFTGRRGWITYNVTNNNERTGIDLVDGSDNLLLGNTASRNGDAVGPQSGDGFVVETPGNTLIGNYANDNDAKGFCVVPGNVGLFNAVHGNGETPEADFHCELE